MKSVSRKAQNPTLLRGPWFAEPSASRLKSPHDVAGARSQFHKAAGSNLHFLLEQRFSWMQAYLDKSSVAVELGSGAGLLREFVRHERLILTDVIDSRWLDVQASALSLPFDDGSIGVLICNHMLHHLASPGQFLDEAARVLKPGGALLINDPQASFLMRLVQRVMRHEGWSFAVNPLDRRASCNDPNDPWSGNSAISDLLFHDHAAFSRAFPNFWIEQDEFQECLIFLLSGGVTAKTFTIPLPRSALKVVDKLDRWLVRWFPHQFALSRRIALTRI